MTPTAGPSSLSDLAAPSDQRERAIEETPTAGPTAARRCSAAHQYRKCRPGLSPRGRTSFRGLEHHVEQVVTSGVDLGEHQVGGAGEVAPADQVAAVGVAAEAARKALLAVP